MTDRLRSPKRLPVTSIVTPSLPAFVTGPNGHAPIDAGRSSSSGCDDPATLWWEMLGVCHRSLTRAFDATR